jgi:hypothetical protein
MQKCGLVQLGTANHKDFVDRVNELGLVQQLKAGIQARDNADIALNSFVSTVKKIIWK